MSDQQLRLDHPDRLKALATSALPDSAPEEVFDRAVRLARHVLRAEVSLFSVVDAERQFFKAQLGLTGHFAEARQTPLSHSFCQYVVRDQHPLVVRDAREHATLQSNLAIPDLGVIAYLGVPVRAPGGEVLGALCATQSTPRDWTDGDLATLTDIAASLEGELELRAALRALDAEKRAAQRARDRLDQAIRSGGLGTYDLDLRTNKADWDAELFHLWGLPRDHPDPFAEALKRIHPDDMDTHERAFAACMDPAGDGRYHAELRVMLDGRDAVRWVASTGLVRFEAGQPVRMVGTVKDISDRKQAEFQNRMLVRELHHRIKNIFAVLIGLLGISARESGSVPEMRESLRSRILSLSAAHDLVRPGQGGDENTTEETDLDSLCRAILAPHLSAATTLTLSGPMVPLSERDAVPLALVLHELATNAAKYGALSVEGGALALTWSVAEGALTFVWRERGGPEVSAPDREQGFGSTLIDLTLRRQMKGDYVLDWDAAGMSCALHIPWPLHSAA